MPPPPADAASPAASLDAAVLALAGRAFGPAGHSLADEPGAWRSLTDILEQHAPGSSLLMAFAQRSPALGAPPWSCACSMWRCSWHARSWFICWRSGWLARAGRGLLAALVYAWWTPVYANVMLYFDSLLAFCVLAALTVYYAGREEPSPRRLILIGFLLGAATLFKQHAWLALGLIFGLASVDA